jgi:hypothetical protein
MLRLAARAATFFELDPRFLRFDELDAFFLMLRRRFGSGAAALFEEEASPFDFVVSVTRALAWPSSV